MKMRLSYLLVLLVAGSILLSCKVFRPDRMLREKGSIEFASLTEVKSDIYKIAPDDHIKMIIKTNFGEQLIRATSEGGQSQMAEQSLTLKVEHDGMVKFPILGRIKLEGMTLREAEDFLETSYSAHYIEPFVQLDIANRRVFVFKGGNNSSVVQLPGINTTLYEALALSGGIGDAKAHRILLIRNNKNKQEVYKIDLSSMKNLSQGNIILQSNDMIYIVPRDRIAQEVLANITPYLSILTAILTMYKIFIR